MATIVCAAKLMDILLKKYYSYVFHAIVGVVIAATVMIIPFGSFALSLGSMMINILCLAIGMICALLINKMNLNQ